MDLHKRFAIVTLTHFYLGNGLHSAMAIVRKLEKNHGYAGALADEPGNSLYNEVRAVLLVAAEHQKGFVKLRDIPRDTIFYPIVSPDQVVSLNTNGFTTLRPRIGHRVRFSCWHGNRAPAIMQWTGEIIQVRREGGLAWYQISRDFDSEIIELRKPFIYAYA